MQPGVRSPRPSAGEKFLQPHEREMLLEKSDYRLKRALSEDDAPERVGLLQFFIVQHAVQSNDTDVVSASLPVAETYPHPCQSGVIEESGQSQDELSFKLGGHFL